MRSKEWLASQVCAYAMWQKVKGELLVKMEMYVNTAHLLTHHTKNYN